MTVTEAVMIIEEEENPSRERLIEAWQLLIDMGLCWQFQGWYGRQATMLIEEGLCTAPQNEQKTIKDPDYCDACECTPCDCSWGLY